MKNESAKQLQALLASNDLLITPCCSDALTGKLIEHAGFSLMFMSGFCVSAARIGGPDLGLISFGEMLDQARNINSAVNIPIIADGDTGYGNAMNVKRTVREYAAAGIAGIMIEDQVSPKRCGHTQGKQVVDFVSAQKRIEAAVDAKGESDGILIMARTDALRLNGIDDAIRRAQSFLELGADITFVEAPESEEQMRRICDEIEGPKMTNQLAGGLTPILPQDVLSEMGFKIAAYPFALLNAMIGGVQKALTNLRNNETPCSELSFAELREILGFNQYYEEEKKYVISDQTES